MMGAGLAMLSTRLVTRLAEDSNALIGPCNIRLRCTRRTTGGNEAVMVGGARLSRPGVL